jgi:hypothetical protein
MGETRDHLLNALEAGDIFFAVASHGDPRIMLAYRTEENAIFARLVTSQTKMEFARNGVSTFVDGDYTCTIASVAALPANEYGILRGLERKLRLSHSLDQARPTDEERGALLNAVKFFEAWPLPED